MEKIIIILLIGIPLLYRIGGWGKWGGKAPRRYGIPALLLWAFKKTGNWGWKAILVVGLTCGALHLGYGAGHSDLERILYGLAISLPSIIICFTWWIFLPPVVFIGGYYLSNATDIFPWAVYEMAVGVSLAILYIQVLIKKGRQ